MSAETTGATRSEGVAEGTTASQFTRNTSQRPVCRFDPATLTIRVAHGPRRATTKDENSQNLLSAVFATWPLAIFVGVDALVESKIEAIHPVVEELMRLLTANCCPREHEFAVQTVLTKKTKAAVYVSPFVDRLNDIGQTGMDLIKNVKFMLAKGDGHLLVLAASIRSVEQLFYCFLLEADLVTVPAKVLEKWAENKFRMPQGGFAYQSIGRPIAYQELSLDQPWQSYDLRHEPTEKGSESLPRTIGRQSPPCKPRIFFSA